ncbi:hypothetical protein [Cerasicoccus arenae]|uniref:hypothetical protein n=1 Tax=Cerasicoccus arenae TaxID=424488 RepID=UPI003CCD661C
MGYKKITGELRKAGFAVGKQFVQRVRREEGLQVPAPSPDRPAAVCRQDCRSRLRIATTSGPGTLYRTGPNAVAS